MKNSCFILIVILCFLSCKKNLDEIINLVAPSSIEVSEVTSNSVKLSWFNSPENIEVARFIIFQDGIKIGETAETSYLVIGLEPNITYFFTISAVDKLGNESAQSVPKEVSTNAENIRAKILVFTKTAGFNHNTKAESLAMIETIARNKNLDVFVDDTGNEFNNPENLFKYKIIFFTNTSGNTLNQVQRNNVEAYAAQRGNFISNHAASDAYAHSSATTVSGNGKGVWDWYAINVTGCSVRNNPNHTSANFEANVTVKNQNTQITTAISFPWNDNEEWYYWEGGYLNNTFTELLTVSSTGSNSYDSARMTAQFWLRPDGGKSFFTSMGHSKNKYTDKDFVQLITNVIDFIL
jgi:uncharacterized protein YchJ